MSVVGKTFLKPCINMWENIIDDQNIQYTKSICVSSSEKSLHFKGTGIHGM